jgi:predicted MPP superfamily phosphohydrolase
MLDLKIVKGFYYVSNLWVGVVFLLFCALILFELTNLFVKLPGKEAAITILVLVAIITIYSMINATMIKTKEIEIPIEGLKKDMTVVQISDVHIGAVNGQEYLNKIVDEINEINPDAIILTGDLFDGSAKLDNEMISPLNNLKAKTFFVTGNHETYEGIENVEKLIKTTNLTFLQNESVDFKGLNIIGVDYTVSKNDLSNEISKLNSSKKPNILLYHVPVKVEELSKNNIQLHLSGHVHHGQIYPFTYLVYLANPYAGGIHNLNNTYAYVSPGTGTWGPAMRFGSSNEITIIKLKAV